MSLLDGYKDEPENFPSSSRPLLSITIPDNDLSIADDGPFEDIGLYRKRATRLCSVQSASKAACDIVWTVLYALTPSFFRQTSQLKLYPTSYLDGLRGVAAFIVYIDHSAVTWFELLRRGYGSTPENEYLIQLPIIRLFYSGRASVAVFFVISGFVLSYKPLKQIRATQLASLLDTLASSVFRRGLRLYIPIAVGTFASMLMAHAQLYHELPESSTEALPPVIENFSDQFKHWLDHMIGISWPFQAVYPNTPYGPPYNGHLWTIPIEYFGSMVVYAMVLGFSRCRTWVRLLLMGFTSLCTLHYERWDLFLFLSGTVLAELSLCRAYPASPDLTSSADEKPTYNGLLKAAHSTINAVKCFSPALNCLVCLISLYFLSYPGGSYPEYEPGPGLFHEYLMSRTPPRYADLWYGYERFWISVGGVMLVFAISNSSHLQRPFTTRFAQYFGDISYSLYIVHGPILFTFGSWYMDKYGGDGSDERYILAFVASGLMNTLLCIWVADLFWRGIDAKSVLFAKRFAEKCWAYE